MSVVTRIRTTETLSVPFTPAEVWAVLRDVTTYPEWWPSTFGVRILNETPEVLGTELEVRPLLGPTVRIRLEELDEESNVRIRFFEGSLEGPGGFHLTPEGAGTKVAYAVDVYVRGLGVAAAGLILPLDRIYSLRMWRILRRLRWRLAKKRKQTERVALETARVATLRAEEAAAELRVSEEESARVALVRAAEEAAASHAAEEAAARAGEEESARVAAARAAGEGAACNGAEEAAARRAAQEEAVRLPEEQVTAIGATPRTPSLAAATRRMGAKLARWLRNAPRVRSSREPLSTDTEGPASNLEVAREYLQMLSADAEPVSIARHFQPDAVSEEFPNQMLPHGDTRDLDEILRFWSNSRQIWDGQRFELLGATGGGAQVAMEIRWTARSARRTEHLQAGQSVGANLALFLRFRDRRIVRQRSYFSFDLPDPHPAPTAPDPVHSAADLLGDSPPLPNVRGPGVANVETALAYFDALSAGASGRAIARFFAEDALQETLPGRLRPARVTSGIGAIQRARDENRATLVSERYELLGATGGGSTVALELQWVARAGPGHGGWGTGDEVQARKAVFLKFRDGLIVTERTYECA